MLDYCEECGDECSGAELELDGYWLVLCDECKQELESEDDYLRDLEPEWRAGR
jgi:ribosome-binding protein aMBF1 (putative translation factor)